MKRNLSYIAGGRGQKKYQIDFALTTSNPGEPPLYEIVVSCCNGYELVNTSGSTMALALDHVWIELLEVLVDIKSDTSKQILRAAIHAMPLLTDEVLK